MFGIAGPRIDRYHVREMQREQFATHAGISSHLDHGANLVITFADVIYHVDQPLNGVDLVNGFVLPSEPRRLQRRALFAAQTLERGEILRLLLADTISPVEVAGDADKLIGHCSHVVVFRLGQRSADRGTRGVENLVVAVAS